MMMMIMMICRIQIFPLDEGLMTIGFRVTNSNSSRILGSLSGFNVWDYALRKEEILRMSSGCGEEAGNVKAWSAVKKAIQGDVDAQNATCHDRQGNPPPPVQTLSEASCIK